MGRGGRSAGLAPLVFIAPAALLILATILTPIVLSFWISLHQWSLLTPFTDMQWVGLDNYVTIFHDPSFLRALTNTVVFAVRGPGRRHPARPRDGGAHPPGTDRRSEHRADAAVLDLCHPDGGRRAHLGLPAVAPRWPGQRAAEDDRAADPAVAGLAPDGALVARAADHLAVPGLLHDHPHRRPDADPRRPLRGRVPRRRRSTSGACGASPSRCSNGRWCSPSPSASSTAWACSTRSTC